LKAAGEKTGFEANTEEGYKLGATLGKAGTSPALDEAIYALKPGETIKTPVKVGENWVVLGVTSRKEADLAEFSKQREQLTQTKVSAKQNELFEDYIGAVQRRMKQDGKIKIYDDVLAAIEEDEPEIATPPRPQLPIQTK
jgi:parvulin-like peptidyl-prolyl isomerase